MCAVLWNLGGLTTVNASFSTAGKVLGYSASNEDLNV
jgi:hypothetical protein